MPQGSQARESAYYYRQSATPPSPTHYRQLVTPRPVSPAAAGYRQPSTPPRPQPQSQRPPKTRQQPWFSLGRKQSGRFVLAGGGMLALAALVIMPGSQSQPQAAAVANSCQQIVQEKSVLSRDQLSELLAISERSSKAAVKKVIAEPYCIMPSVAVRQGAEAEREAYPLAFDPQTWLVVLYEGDEYAGYDFSFRRQ